MLFFIVAAKLTSYERRRLQANSVEHQRILDKRERRKHRSPKLANLSRAAATESTKALERLLQDREHDKQGAGQKRGNKSDTDSTSHFVIQKVDSLI